MFVHSFVLYCNIADAIYVCQETTILCEQFSQQSNLHHAMLIDYAYQLKWYVLYFKLLQDCTNSMVSCDVNTLLVFKDLFKDFGCNMLMAFYCFAIYFFRIIIIVFSASIKGALLRIIMLLLTMLELLLQTKVAIHL